MNIPSLKNPAVWACLVLGQLSIVYGGAALGALAPTSNFGFGRLLENPDVGLLQAALALVILGLLWMRSPSPSRSRSWRIAAFAVAGVAVAVSLYHLIAYFGGSEFSLLMASALLVKDYK